MPAWIEPSVVLAIHDEQLSEHSGLAGVRDENALLSALARPRQLDAYGTPTLHDLAAAYAFGLARNHAFNDGNKRTSLVAAELFLALNGVALVAGDAAIVAAWLAIADGRLDEPAISRWLAEHSRDIAGE